MNTTVTLRPMEAKDYDKVRKLWSSIQGFAIRSIDDSRENIERFLSRNAGISVVAVRQEEIVGAILCGHDGRTATFYHVCVSEACRRQGIGKQMVVFCMNALIREQINTISLVAFTDNNVGNSFWNGIGWKMRADVNQYEFKLNEKNVIAFNR